MGKAKRLLSPHLH